MKDYSAWKRKPGKVTGLLLDAKNPRIPPAGRGSSQNELIAELVEHDDVYGLAKGIVEHGFFPTETPVVVEENGQKIVVEGNRRLAALKVLISPDSAPEKHKKKFRVLAAEVPAGVLDQIETLVAPSRVDATPLIIERHTKSHLQKWEPAMQAHFYQSLLDEGATRDDLQRAYGITSAELADALRMHTLYQVACGMKVSDEAREKVLDPHTFPLTNLERLLESIHCREFLRLEPDDENLFTIKGKPESFCKAFAKMIEDVAMKKVTSRTVNDAKGIKDYLGNIREYRPSRKEKGSFGIKKLIKQTAAETPKPQPAPEPRAPRLSRSMVPAGTKCFLGSPRIKDVFTEVKRLQIDTMPNSAAVMIRVLLEMAISHRLDSIQEWKDHVENLRVNAKQKKPDDWYPPLKDQLLWLVEKNVLGLRGLPLKPLRQFAQRDTAYLNLDSLNQFTHNPNAMPSQDDLRAISVILAPTWEGLLSEPPTAAAKE